MKLGNRVTIWYENGKHEQYRNISYISLKKDGISITNLLSGKETKLTASFEYIDEIVIAPQEEIAEE